MASDTVTVQVAVDDETDEVTLPRGLVDMLREANDETIPEVVGDVTMMAFAQRIHGAVHHAEGEPTEEIAAVDDLTMELFEERFGESFGDVTGHDH